MEELLNVLVSEHFGQGRRDFAVETIVETIVANIMG